MKDVAVIIVNWNGGEVVKTAVKTAVEHTRDVSSEIIVVDNASSDGSDVAIQKMGAPNVRVVRTFNNGGYGKGNNIGAELADARYLAFVNPDVVFTQDVLGAVVRYMDDHPDLGIVGPRLTFPDGRVQPTTGRRLPTFLTDLSMNFSAVMRLRGKPWLNGFLVNEENSRETFPVQVIHGAFFVIESQLFDEVGRFDGRQFMYSDEILLCSRVLKTGRQIVYLGDAEAVHIGGELTTPVGGRSASFQCQSGYVYYEEQKGRCRAEAHAIQSASVALGMLMARRLLGQPRERQEREQQILKWFLNRTIDIPR